MNCEHSRLYLSAYLDEELDVPGILVMQQHIDECHGCRAVLEQQASLRQALHDPALYAHPTPEFAERIRNQIRRAAQNDTESRFVSLMTPFRMGWYGWMRAAAVVGIALFIALPWAYRLRGSSERAIEEAVIAGHIRSLQAEHLVDIPSSNQHSVKPWFQGRLDFAPAVPDLGDAGWTLVGGRLDYIAGRTVAAVVYRRRLHDINVFIWPKSGAADETANPRYIQGYELLHWTRANMAYWVVSDLNRKELDEFADLLRRR
jgi:anti-sigma factor RsiW